MLAHYQPDPLEMTSVDVPLIGSKPKIKFIPRGVEMRIRIRMLIHRQHKTLTRWFSVVQSIALQWYSTNKCRLNPGAEVVSISWRNLAFVYMIIKELPKITSTWNTITYCGDIKLNSAN